MCGIFCLSGNHFDGDEITKLKHRGPDSIHSFLYDSILFGFTRLMINGIDKISDQPFFFEGVILICNGEIYNFKELYFEYKIEKEKRTNSDCEIIIHLYKKIGIERTLKALDGEFAFVLYDTNKKVLYVARDPLGVRGLVIGTNRENNDIAFASEIKALKAFDKAEQFPAGTYMTKVGTQMNFVSYYNVENIIPLRDPMCSRTLIDKIRRIVEKSVRQRVLVSDRKVGCCLSGGIDSSIVTMLASKFVKNPSDLHTFSIGLLYKNSKGENIKTPDLMYAEKVACFLGTNHHEIIFSEKEFLSEIEETVRTVESFDVTTIRASVGHRLLSKWVSENTDVKVLLSSDIPDEVCPGYKYLSFIDNPEDFHKETIKLVKELPNFDLLRTDRSISAYGLEARCPFSDKNFVNLFLSLSYYDRCYSINRIEKEYLRKAFIDDLPPEIVWRKKEAFSNGVSSSERDWATIIKEHVEKFISDQEFFHEKYMYSPIPFSKEALWYRRLFEKYYPGKGSFIPHYWLPNQKYCKAEDPSARTI